MKHMGTKNIAVAYRRSMIVVNHDYITIEIIKNIALSFSFLFCSVIMEKGKGKGEKQSTTSLSS